MKTLEIEDWMMKDCDSRSWIGGGLPSRDHVKEKREHRKRRWGSVRGSHREVSRHNKVCHIVLLYMYVGFSVDRHVHMWVC
jgi:hypothetical protein